jgi:hypothetical protein
MASPIVRLEQRPAHRPAVKTLLNSWPNLAKTDARVLSLVTRQLSWDYSAPPEYTDLEEK